MTLTPQDDPDLLDENVRLQFSAGGDTSFSGLSITRNLTVLDDDEAELLVTPATKATVPEEGNGVSYGISLNTAPQSGTVVVVEVSSNSPKLAVSPAQVTLDEFNFNNPTANTFVVTALDDTDTVSETDLELLFSINASASNRDADFDTLTQLRLVDILDNDAPAILTDPTNLTIAEDGGTATVDVELSTQPSSEGVIVDVTSLNLEEATVSPAELTFSDQDWNQPQTLTVTALNDNFLTEDTAVVELTTRNDESDDDHDNASTSVLVTLTNDDEAQINVAPLEDVTLEEGVDGENSYEVVLNARPRRAVLIEMSINETALTPVATSVFANDQPQLRVFSETTQLRNFSVEDSLTLAPNQLIFTPDDWDLPQTVTILNAEDPDLIDEQATLTFEIKDVLSDDNYALVERVTRQITILDNDTGDFTVTPSTETVVEGETVEYTIALTACPENEVTLVLTSNNAAIELEVDTVTFASENCNEPKP